MGQVERDKQEEFRFEGDRMESHLDEHYVHPVGRATEAEVDPALQPTPVDWITVAKQNLNEATGLSDDVQISIAASNISIAESLASITDSLQALANATILKVISTKRLDPKQQRS